MTPTLTIRARGRWSELNTRLAGLSERLRVGIFSGVTPDGDSLAEVLACQEYGTSTIPARPSLGPTMRQMRSEIVR
jgi:DNA-binding GntR family transcriptional regulator